MARMVFEVKSTDVHEKKGISKTGRPYLIREQSAYMNTGKAYPVEVKIGLDDLAPLEPGEYEIGPQCFYVGRFGDVGVDLAKAQRVAGSKPAAATLAGAK